jgi:hypothetical protein
MHRGTDFGFAGVSFQGLASVLVSGQGLVSGDNLARASLRHRLKVRGRVESRPLG